MASGSQMCNGNMALFPAPPMNISPKAKRNHCRTALCQRHLIGAEGVCTGIISIDKDTYKETQVSKTGNDKAFFEAAIAAGFV